MYKILASTLFLGKNVVYVPECHSTNSLLMELAQKSNLAEGTLVITDNQTKGRGQRGNGWEAEPNQNLTFSFLLKPTFLQASEQFLLNIAVSLGLADYLQSRVSEINQHVKIKWPNDMMLNNKKVTGILIENTLAGNTIQQSVVGIGMNINQASFSYPTATSLNQVTGVIYDLSDELHLMGVEIESRYLQLRSGRGDDLRSEYVHQLYRMGKVHSFKINEEVVMGVIEGIDPIGKLKVKIEEESKVFGMKEIQFV